MMKALICVMVGLTQKRSLPPQKIHVNGYVEKLEVGQIQGDSWMYPYQRTPMGKSLYKPLIVGIYGL